MLDKISHIARLINKGYKLPHDVEVVAYKIYDLSQCIDFIYNDIVKSFIHSVMNSKYNNIIEITYNYMNRLVYSDNLLYEEFLKVIHLFDSINIFVFLGLKGPAGLIEKADADMLFFLKKHSKWSEILTSGYIENKKWWQRVVY
ncbi:MULTISPECIES: hypothetical protein [unclassified Brenneria]|uniref:hypothetical protein n=1 Tax=unclassified Brenneria TaxID=2634434 RepID=UPI0029C24AE2|nr:MULTISPECIES: hypothetical protein [unclassified Brenneria]MDX5631146.1 hypothetical protein [Brenneria sp. L3-3Z]MDX5698219.1 hypothetical protein [Brenneria sp. L4-2C]